MKKIKVGLLIDEFFGGAGTGFGGYGFLARYFIAKYIPNAKIQVDVLLGKGKKNFSVTQFHEDNVDLYVEAIKKSMENEPLRQKMAEKARDYVCQNHNIFKITKMLRKFILRAENNCLHEENSR